MEVRKEITITEEAVQSGIGAVMIRLARGLEEEREEEFGDSDVIRLLHEVEIERPLQLDDCIFSLQRIAVGNTYGILLGVQLSNPVLFNQEQNVFSLTIGDDENGEYDLSEIFSARQLEIIRELQKRLL